MFSTLRLKSTVAVAAAAAVLLLSVGFCSVPSLSPGPAACVGFDVGASLSACLPSPSCKHRPPGPARLERCLVLVKQIGFEVARFPLQALLLPDTVVGDGFSDG